MSFAILSTLPVCEVTQGEDRVKGKTMDKPICQIRGCAPEKSKTAEKYHKNTKSRAAKSNSVPTTASRIVSCKLLIN